LRGLATSFPADSCCTGANTDSANTDHDTDAYTDTDTESDAAFNAYD
jgi:hypothetical protein